MLIVTRFGDPKILTANWKGIGFAPLVINTEQIVTAQRIIREDYDGDGNAQKLAGHYGVINLTNNSSFSVPDITLDQILEASKGNFVDLSNSYSES